MHDPEAIERVFSPDSTRSSYRGISASSPEGTLDHESTRLKGKR